MKINTTKANFTITLKLLKSEDYQMPFWSKGNSINNIKVDCRIFF